MTKKITIIQKENVRYTFKVETVNNGNSSPLYRIDTETLCANGLGASLTHRYVSKDYGNNFYKEMMLNGFKRFRNVREVSWYATTENNTPFDERWGVQGEYLVPIKSRVLN